MLADQVGGEFGADFVVRAGNGGADGGDAAVGAGAEIDHGGDGRLCDAARGALPAGMCRADHPGFGVGEQDRRAVGGENAERQTVDAGDEGVGLGDVIGIGLAGDFQHGDGVHLLQRHQLVE